MILTVKSAVIAVGIICQWHNVPERTIHHFQNCGLGNDGFTYDAYKNGQVFKGQFTDKDSVKEYVESQKGNDCYTVKVYPACPSGYSYNQAEENEKE